MNKKKGNPEPGNSKKTKKEKSKVSKFFNRFSTVATKATGSAYAFIIAVVVIIVWAASGPIFGFSDTWQLVINTGTTIITFLMVFIIQHSQNKDQIALQLKLNELIVASKASNKLISVEDLDDDELELMKRFYEDLSGLSKEEKQNKIKTLEEEKEERKKMAATEKEVEENRIQGPPRKSKQNQKRNQHEQNET